MAPSGLSAQLGFAEQTDYATLVTVSRFYEFVPPLAPKYEIGRIKSKALRAGARVQRSDRWSMGKRSVSGDVNLQVDTKGMGLFFKHMLGGVATTQPAAGPSPSVYRHTFTPGDLPVGLSMQLGQPDTGGTVNPFTYSGVKFTGWEMGCAVDEIATLKLPFVGREEVTDTALAVASYPVDVDQMTFVHGAMSIGGSSALVKKINIKGTTPADVERYFLGSPYRQRPLENDQRLFSGTMDCEFESLSHYNRYKAGTETEVILDFVSDVVIEDAFFFECKVTITTRFDGETPSVPGPGVLQQAIPFEAMDNSTTSIKIEYTTTDATP